MGYTPLFDTLLNGTMYGKWPHNGIWALLLSRASREGVINEVPESLAAHIGISVEQLMASIRYFMEPDESSTSPDADGRRLELIDPRRSWGWRVINHAKYKEKARKKTYDDQRTVSGADAERKRAERAERIEVPTTPDASREVPLSSPTPTPTPEPVRGRASAPRGTRLPEDFTLTEERRAIAVREGLDADRTFAKFRNHWLSSTRNATKRDWDKTWDNWCITEADRKPKGRSSSLTDHLKWTPNGPNG
jgi:hypothetical protein